MRPTQSNLRNKTSFKLRSIRRWYAFMRICKSGCVNFVRNAWLSVAAISMMVITLTIILFSLIANQAFRHTVRQITDRIDVSVYLKDEVSKDQTEQLLEDIRRLENVKQANYISKTAVYEEYIQDNKDDPSALAAVSLIDNPFPATIRIKPKDPNNLENIRSFIESEEVSKLQSDETSYSGDTKKAIDSITRNARFIGQMGVVAVLIFAAVSVMIIFNTIQMAIFNRRDELAIMQLLGASKRYIQGPFLMEAFLYGIIAGLISLLAVNIMLQVQTSVLDATRTDILDVVYMIQYLGDHFLVLLAMELGLGVAIAMLSSWFATSKHIRKDRKKSARR